MPYSSQITALGVTAGTQVAPGPAVVNYVNIHTAAAIGTVKIYNGTSTSDPQVYSYELAVTAANTDPYLGLYCNNGVFVVTTGTAVLVKIGIE